MSSSDTPARSLHGRMPLRLAAVLGIALALGGCFRPLYGTSTTTGVAVQDQLAAIELATVTANSRDNDRLAHYTQGELGFRLGRGSPETVAKQYRLETSVSESVQTTIVNTDTGNAESALLTGRASFRLLPAGGGEPIMTGTAVASSAYTRSPQRFASLRAARDAQIRVATALAEQIHTRLAAKFASGR